MLEIDSLLKSAWGAEKWINEGWEHLNAQEKQTVVSRMTSLFEGGLPFEVKHDKILYIYTFSFLAQLEVLAIQVPLRFESHLTDETLRAALRQQLVDEVFHGLVFTKIVYMLSSPYALPPDYNQHVEVLCDFIRTETCPKVGLTLLNLIGEGWIEEIFYTLHRYGIAKKVFDVIIEDEHRHVCEAELYRAIGLPEDNVIKEKVRFLEDHFLTKVLFQNKYTTSIAILLGANGISDFFGNLHQKHCKQLSKINLTPGPNWQLVMEMGDILLPNWQLFEQGYEPTPLSPIRQVLMTQWTTPRDPTMVGQFDANISPLRFFEKVFPPETLTTLSLQAISHGIAQDPLFRGFLQHQELYTTHNTYIGLVVKLPDCGDHMGTIVFKDCHLIPTKQLALRIREIIKVMVFCFKMRESLELMHPYLKELVNETVKDQNEGVYRYPLIGSPIISVSNIGHCGYSQTKSPLRPSEPMKFTLLQVEKRMVYNKETNTFNPEDIMPVSVSADHRIFDGNIPVPKIFQRSFNVVFDNMLKMDKEWVETPKPSKKVDIMDSIEQFVENHLEISHRLLLFMQTFWLDHMSFEDLISSELIQKYTKPQEATMTEAV